MLSLVVSSKKFFLSHVSAFSIIYRLLSVDWHHVVSEQLGIFRPHLNHDSALAYHGIDFLAVTFGEFRDHEQQRLDVIGVPLLGFEDDLKYNLPGNLPWVIRIREVLFANPQTLLDEI